MLRNLSDKVRILFPVFSFLLSFLLYSDISAQTDAMPQLKPCPDTPNCVSSLSPDEKHAIPPIQYNTDIGEAKRVLLEVIKQLPRTEIVKDEPGYLHATFTSLVFRFVDDVEFVFDGKSKLIHVRSASRTGYSDLGVNRRRVEKIRKLFKSALKQ